MDRLWDDTAGIFRARDLADDTLVDHRGVAGLLPLVVPGLPADIVRALTDTLDGPRFHAPATGLVPSDDLTGPTFHPTRYWRGPAWFNTAWLVERGLRTHGRHARARTLREALVREAGRTGFAEYVDPLTGEGRGARQFSWTAALALDLLHTDGHPDAPAAGPDAVLSLTAPDTALPPTGQEEYAR